LNDIGEWGEVEPQRRKGRKENMREVDPITNHTSSEVIGAAIEVHRTLGPGFLESVYEEALCHELHLRQIDFKQQYAVGVIYIVSEGDGSPIGADYQFQCASLEAKRVVLT
jgi:GxxExxY protein